MDTLLKILAVVGCVAVSCSSKSAQAQTNLKGVQISQVIMIEASLQCFNRHGISQQNQVDFVKGVLEFEVKGMPLLSEQEWRKLRKEGLESRVVQYISNNGGCRDIAQRYKDWLKTYGTDFPLRGESEGTPFPL